MSFSTLPVSTTLPPAPLFPNPFIQDSTFLDGPQAISPINGQLQLNDAQSQAVLLHLDPSKAQSHTRNGIVWERLSKALVDPLKAFATHWNNAQNNIDRKFGDNISDWLNKHMFKPGSIGSWFIPKKYAHSGLTEEEKKGLAAWSANAEAAQSWIKFVFYAKVARDYFRAFKQAKNIEDPVARANTRLESLGAGIFNAGMFFDKIGHISAAIFLSNGIVPGALVSVALGRFSCLMSYFGAFMANGATTRNVLHNSEMDTLRSQVRLILNQTERVATESVQKLYHLSGSRHQRAIIYTRGALLAFKEHEGKVEKRKSLNGTSPKHLDICSKLYDDISSIQEKLDGDPETQAKAKEDLRSSLQTAIEGLKTSEPKRCQDLARILEQAVSFLDGPETSLDPELKTKEGKIIGHRNSVIHEAERTFGLLYKNTIRISTLLKPSRRSIIENVLGLRPLAESIIKRFQSSRKRDAEEQVINEIAQLNRDNEAAVEQLREFAAEQLQLIKEIREGVKLISSDTSLNDPTIDITKTQKMRRDEFMHLLSAVNSEKKVTDIAAKAGADSRFGESLGKFLQFWPYYVNGLYQYFSGQVVAVDAISLIKGGGITYPLWYVGAVALCTGIGSYNACKTAIRKLKEERSKKGDDRSPANMLYYGATVFSTGLMMTAALPAANPITRSLGIAIYAAGVIVEVGARFLPDLKIRSKRYRDWARRHHFEREADLIGPELAAQHAAIIPADADFIFNGNILNPLDDQNIALASP